MQNIDQFVIDELNKTQVDNLLKAVIESKLESVEKKNLIRLLDRWNRALTLTKKLRVVF